MRVQSKAKQTRKQKNIQQDMLHQLCQFYHFDINNNNNNKYSYSVQPFRCTSTSPSNVSVSSSVNSSSKQSGLSNKSRGIKENNNVKSNKAHDNKNNSVATSVAVSHKQYVSRTQVLRDVFDLLDVRRCGVVYNADLSMLHMLMEQELSRVDKLL